MDFDDNDDLLKRLKSGEESAFEILYNQYSVDIYRKLLKMVKDISLAEELTQDIFVKIWDKRNVINTEQPFRYYILTIANNIVNDFYRKVSRDSRLQDEIIAASTELYNPTEEDLFYKESKNILDKAIAGLPKQQALVFDLCKIQGKSYEEVAKMLNISTSTISNHIVKATKTIKKEFFSSKEGFILLVSAFLASRY
ncbi:RNA polymerase sigma factor [Pedobacter sp. ok626]|uniref:RNA polymerase sigma factor n=1 Tax=Pedobacter sp. ok626 TaxID=1761882 RepID=UPI00158798D1|nr:sigma-70 family RNA polymerase sigma factor [Pedobacter sp. ok626]